MVDILLASYNGEKYIAEQIESIISQSFSDWNLIIQDDCSADKTIEIVRVYAKKYPYKISVHINEKPSGSAKANFFSMLRRVKNDYVMFCDQDDVWNKDKIEITFKKMREAENENNRIPVLVHSDLKVADCNLKTLHKSFVKYQGLNPNYNTINKLVVQNNVTGCTVMINKFLVDLLTAETEGALMHDWWLALVAGSFGKIAFCPEQLVLYRQHGNNQLGAVNNRSAKGVLHIITKSAETKKRVMSTYIQAEQFYKLYKDKLCGDINEILKIYISMHKKSKLKRIYYLLKYRFLKQNIFAAAAQLIFC